MNHNGHLDTPAEWIMVVSLSLFTLYAFYNAIWWTRFARRERRRREATEDR